ncbi:MAG: hypothetical protein RIQ33_2192 [Bacteroidota bacterium]
MKIKAILLTIFAVVVGILLNHERIISNSFTPPSGNTGSTGSGGNTCFSCHSSATGSSATITYTVYNAGTTNVATTYQSGASYDIMVTVSGSGNASARYGFAISAEDNTGNAIGSFAANAQTDLLSTAISPITASHNMATGLVNTWYFKWQAPAAGYTGTIQFDMAGVYGDSSLSSSGNDEVATNSFTLSYCVPTTAIISASTCSNQPYNFNGNNLTASGIYNDTFTNTAGCDSIISLQLSVNNISSNIINASICAGQNYIFGLDTLTTANTYYDTLTNAIGCDSLTILNLTVNQPSTHTISQIICCGNSVNFNNQTITSAGTYYDTLINYLGCDSFLTLQLTMPVLSVVPMTNFRICATQPGVMAQQNFMFFDSIKTNFGNGNPSNFAVSAIVFSNTSGYLPSIASPDTTATTTLGAFNASVQNNSPSNILLNKYLAPSWGGKFIIIFKITDSTGVSAYDTVAANVLNNKYCRAVAVDDVRTIAVNTPILINVQANDIHVKQGAGAVMAGASPLHGTNTYILSASNKTYAHYKPFQSYSGIDSFYYTSMDTNAIKLGNVSNLLADTGWVKIIINPTLAPPAGFNNPICLGTSVTLGSLTCLQMFPEGSPLNTLGAFTDSVKWWEDTVGKAISPLSNPVFSNCNASVTLTPQYNLNSSNNYIAEYDGMLDTVFIYTGGCAITIDAGVDKIVCLGSGVNIGGAPTITGGDPPFVIQWTAINGGNLNTPQSIVQNPLITPTAVGIYTYAVFVTDAQNQTGTDTMVLSVFSNPSYSTSYDTICANGTYAFGGGFINTSGTYLDTIPNTYGCDSFITVHLFVKPTHSYAFGQTICTGTTYNLNGKILSSTGIYRDTIPSVNGCDSFILFNLVVVPTSASTIIQSICSNSFYSFKGNNLTSSGVYYDTLINANGCDSIVTLNLTVNPTDTVMLPITICSNQTYFFKNQNLNTSGTYIDTLSNQFGCDSIVTLNLTVHPISTSGFSQTVCSNIGYQFNNILQNTTGIYFDTLINALGCDSIITLTLTVINSPNTILSQTVCNNDSALFKGVYLHTTGIYFDTLLSYNSCDSLVTFNFTVLPIITTTYNQNVCVGNSILFNGNLLNTNGTYLDTLTSTIGCDSFIVMNLYMQSASFYSYNQTICSNNPYLFNGQLLNNSGNYFDTLISYVGCDSFITLNLTVNPISNYSYNQIICSNNPYLFNGNMLSTTGTYLDTLQNQFSCDSFITLNLTVNPISNYSFSQSICAGNTVQFNGNTLNSSGSYLDTLVNYLGCDSFITFALTVNPISNFSYNYYLCSGNSYIFNGNNITTTGIYYDTLQNQYGCDSFVTLHFFTVSPSYFTNNQTICVNHPYLFNGTNLTIGGTYYDTLVSYVGCDSFITLNLIVHPISTYNHAQTICSNQTYLFNNQLRNTTGIYFDTLQNYLGCDSFITLNLTVNAISNTSFVQTICNGTSFSFNNKNLTTSGLYHDTLVNYVGCDSFVHLTLIVLPNASHNYSQTICSGHVINFYGNNISSAGTFTHTILGGAANGCDSTVILTTSIIPSSFKSYSQTICSNYPIIFNNHSINTTGVYFDTLVNYLGCDSFIQLSLTVVVQQVTHIYQNICWGSSYVFFTNTYTNAGTYFDSIPSTSGGCAQIYVLHLTVQSSHTSNVTKTICGNSFYYAGHTYTVGGLHTIYIPLASGCDSIINLNLTLTSINTNIVANGNSLTSLAGGGSTIQWIDCTTKTIIANGNSFVPTVSGNYSAVISLNGCTDTSACYYVYIPVSGINNTNNLGWIKLYPNPAQDDVALNINCPLCKQLKLEIMDIRGKILRVENINNQPQFIIHRNDLAAGIYFIKLTNQDGQQSMMKLIWE